MSGSPRPGAGGLTVRSATERSADFLERWARWGYRHVRRLWRWLARTWRASLQLRVVTTTMLLGLVVVGLLGTYLYTEIADGLQRDRIASAQAEAAQLVNETQVRLDGTDRTGNLEELDLAVRSIVQNYLASPTREQSRYVLFTRSAANTNRTVLQPMVTGILTIRDVPPDLRAAVAADPSRQQTKISTIANPSTGEPLTVVVVGSVVDVPVAGQYDLYFFFPMQREIETLALITNSFFLGGVTLVLLVGVVAWVVTRQVVSPVRRAASVAQRLASGQLNERMASRGSDDLALLGESFNEMADHLQSQIRQLEALSRVQQRFVSDVSHELRTPLTTIRMAADLIHDARREFEPTVGRSAELLQHELDRFEELLADLLEISRFDAGAAALDVEATDLRSVVTRVCHSVRALAARRGSEIVVRGTEEPAVADVDARRVERILRNLVVNAIEHGEGGPVELDLGGNDTAVAIAVRDHGVGLKPGEASLVFNRFWRADPARARSTGGTGLGLAISLEDARLHHGWLQAWGEPGTGSVFRLTLPRRTGEAILDSPLPLHPMAEPVGDEGEPGAVTSEDTGPVPFSRSATPHRVTP